jgi:uncharacterized membrane protein YgcG
VRAFALLALAWSSVVSADPWGIDPPPRGRWSLDQTGRIAASTLSTIDRLAAELDASGAGQLGVLVVRTTSGVKPRDFATGVFNSWGVGHAQKNDGVLLFVALDDRKAEIVLGDGSAVTSAQTDVVMQRDVVANFKQGQPDRALLTASTSLVDLMQRAAGRAPRAPHPGDNTGIGPAAYVTHGHDKPRVDEALAEYAHGHRAFPERSPRTWVVDLSEVLTPSERARLDVAASDIYASGRGRTFFLVARRTAPYPGLEGLAARLLTQVKPLGRGDVAVIALDVGQGQTALLVPDARLDDWERRQLEAARETLQREVFSDRVGALVEAQGFAQRAVEGRIPPRPVSDVLEQAIEAHLGTFATGSLGAFGLGIFGLVRWNRRRTRSCSACRQPRLLLSEDADDEHLQPAQRTEENIGSVDYDVWWCERCHDALVLRYGKWFSRFSGCSGCGAKTLRSTSTTITPATEYSSGTEQIDRSCMHCNFRETFTRTIPRLASSSDSSSSWSDSGSSSFGGGSSSGGGSSGSW